MQRPHESLRRGLLGAWCPSLGATGYTLLDRSEYRRHGTLVNMGGQTNWQASGSGVALNFDGSNDTTSIPAASHLTTTVWASMWFRITATLTPASGTRYGFLNICQETGTPFRQAMTIGINVTGLSPTEGTGNLNVVTFDSNASPTLSGAYTTALFTSATSRWYHCSAGWDGAAWRIFIDGVEDTNAQGTQRAATATPANISWIASQSTTFGRYSPILVDDVRVYNRALTPAEIRLLASRRGIGLVPQRQRRTSASSKRLHLNVGGVWKETVPYINVGGTWKEAAVYRHDGTSFKN